MTNIEDPKGLLDPEKKQLRGEIEKMMSKLHDRAMMLRNSVNQWRISTNSEEPLDSLTTTPGLGWQNDQLRYANSLVTFLEEVRRALTDDSLSKEKLQEYLGQLDNLANPTFKQ
jgi:hypothetical protein